VQFRRTIKDGFVIGALSIGAASSNGSSTNALATPPSITADTTTPTKIVRGKCEDEPVAHFTIAHFNDLQAHYGERVGGKNVYGLLAGYLRGVKEEEPRTLVVDAGDDYEKGSIAELRSMGESTRRMIQALPIDVRTIGNHDFAYGESSVLRDIALSAHPVLAANIHYADGRTPFLPYVSARVGCVRVGIVGLVAGHYGSDDQMDGGVFDGVFVHDDKYARILREQVAAHRSEVDVMIALTHIGLYVDLDLAAQIPDVDVFVGGHTEDLLPNGQPYVKPGGRMGWVFQAGHYGEHVGRADFTFDRATKTLRLQRYTMTDVNEKLPYAEDVARLAQTVERAATPDAHVPIAVARESIDHEDMPALVMRAARDRWAVDALFIGKDVFWTGLPSGAITLQRLFDAVPVQREPSGTPGFTSLWIVSMTGAELLDLKQKSFSGYATILPDALSPTRTYRVVVDKRALEHPHMVAGDFDGFGEHARFGGEIVDVLDAYAHARTARGFSL
jgi:2',3'-cyclic-nucleotide 2'-phosphodiesterase (5'-nucleotidase family)